MECSNWKRTKVIQLKDDEKAVLEGDKIIVYRKPKVSTKRTIDITSKCSVGLVESHTSDGYYCAIRHEGKTIFALGVDGKSKVQPFSYGRYRLIPAPNATVSFRILEVISG